MTIFHQLQGYLVTFLKYNPLIFTYFKYFPSTFALAKFDVMLNPFDVTSITNLHTNLAYLGLAKIIVALDGTRSLFFKDVG